MWLEVAWPKRGYDLSSSSILPIERSRLSGKRGQIRNDDGARRTTTRAHFVRVPRTSDVRPAAFIGCLPRPPRARTGSRSPSVRSAHHNATIGRRVVFSSLQALKGTGRSFPETTLFLSLFLSQSLFAIQANSTARALFNPISRKFAISLSTRLRLA